MEKGTDPGLKPMMRAAVQFSTAWPNTIHAQAQGRASQYHPLTREPIDVMIVMRACLVYQYLEQNRQSLFYSNVTGQLSAKIGIPWHLIFKIVWMPRNKNDDPVLMYDQRLNQPEWERDGAIVARQNEKRVFPPRGDMLPRDGAEASHQGFNWKMFSCPECVALSTKAWTICRACSIMYGFRHMLTGVVFCPGLCGSIDEDATGAGLGAPQDAPHPIEDLAPEAPSSP